MLNDYGMEFTEAEAAGGTNVGATATFTGYMDAGAAKDWGAGEKLVPLVRLYDAAVNNCTSLTFDVIGSDANDGSGNPQSLSSSGAIALASLTPKDKLFKLPPLASGYLRRYLTGKVTLAGTAPTAGRVKFWLAPIDAVPENAVNP